MSLGPIRTLEIDISSNEGKREYRLSQRILATQPPSVDTIWDVKALLELNGYADGLSLGLVDLAAICSGVRVRMGRKDIKSGRWYWNAESTFATKTGKDPESSKKEDPKDRPWKFSVRSDAYVAPALKNTAGDPIVNAAGDAVRREKKRARSRITIDGYCATFDPAWSKDTEGGGLLYSRNAALWNGPWGTRYATLFASRTVPLGEGFLDVLTADMNFEKGEVQIAFHAEVLCDGDLHVDRCWNEGARAYQDEDDLSLGIPPVPVFDDTTGRYLSGPAFLATDGTQLPPGGTPNELVNNFYPTRDWSVLPFWGGTP